MNERIFKMALAAMDFHGVVDTDTDLRMNNAELEKFAELIIKECVKIARVADSDDQYYAWYMIKEHFGVEETKAWICHKCGADRTKTVCPLGFGATFDGRCPMTLEAQ